MTLYDERGNYLVGGQLPLATRKGRQIPNDRRVEQHPDRLRAAKEIVLRNHLSARVRSLTGVYNCMGMIFAARRTYIEPDELPMILEDDDYRRLGPQDEVIKGDMVVYKDTGGYVSHVGLVADAQRDLREGTTDITVLSQWGQDGEYFHHIDDINPFLGTATEYWTDRR